MQATNGTQSGNHQGLKAGTLFATGSDDCVRVSSLSVINGNGFVEWGWILGWSYGSDQGGVCGSTTTYHSSPLRFAYWQPINGGPHCALEGETTGGTSYNISLADGNSDTVWNYYWGTSSIGKMDVNFDRGSLRTNAERSNTSDIARAHFNNLKFQVAGQTTWYSFVDLDPGPHDDPIWFCIMVSQTNQKVENQPQTCVD